MEVDLFFAFDMDGSFGEDEDELGGVDELLLDNERRDRGRIWVDMPQSIGCSIGKLLRGVGGNVTILISSSSNMPISPEI